MRILLASDFDDDLRPRPGASWWAQRVFWFAQPGDVVVVADYPEKEFAAYALGLLQVDPGSVGVVYVDTGSAGKLTRANLLTDQVLDAVRAAVAGAGEVEEVIMLCPTVLGVDFVTALGLSPELVSGGAFLSQGGGQLANSKALFRAVARGNAVPVAAGGVSAGFADTADAVARLLSQTPSVILKKEYMSGGSGNYLVTLDEKTSRNGAKYLAPLGSPAELADWLRQTWAQLTDDGRHRFVFESYHAGSRACFAEFKIGGEVVFSGSGEMNYLPLAASQTIPFPDIDSAAGALLVRGGAAIAEAYRAMGYRGYLSADGILTPSGEVFFTEANARITGSTHIYVGIGERLIGAGYAKSHFLIDRIWPETWRADSFSAALSALDEAGILYDGQRQEGVVLCSPLDRRDNTIMHCIVARNLEKGASYHDALEKIFHQR
jgi:Pre ATP-grasp domain/PGM1 C-terminal domain